MADLCTYYHTLFLCNTHHGDEERESGGDLSGLRTYHNVFSG